MMYIAGSRIVKASGSSETLPFEVGRTSDRSLEALPWIEVTHWTMAPTERIRRSRREKRRARKRRQK